MTLLTDYKSTLRLGLPIVVGQLGVIVMGFADTMMVGRFSTDALAAASFANALFNLITYMLLGYSYGLTPLVSSLYGQGRSHEAGSTLKHGIVCNVSIALLLMLAMTVVFFCLPHFGQPEEILPLVRPYYLCLLLSMLFVALFNATRQFTDAITDTTVGMAAILSGNALNILGNWLLIYGIGPFPELGLLGAGISTAFSRLYMALFMSVVIGFRGRYAAFRRGFQSIPLRRSSLVHVNAKSMPVSLQMGMETGSFTFSGIMAGWISAIDLATFQVMVTVGTLGFLLYYSFGSSMSIRLSAAYGQRDWTAVRRAYRSGLHILLAMCAVSSLIFLFLGKYIILGFSSDPAVMALAVSLIPFLVLYQLGDAMQVCYSNALRATGHVRPVMSVAFISYIVVNIPVAYLLGFTFHLGSKGIFLAFTVGLVTAAALFAWHFRKALHADCPEHF